eukprot:TRINITY_DN13726_c0_g2_i1.p1 TRINITY_DN13726_c0_g2~~TRINITY_DN13726_c0_g2_i1.p1  ORF type:complete len:267 (+),score=52.03 TRINITY_DN13726_c0_g2_i1:160-960(+)
MVQLCLDLGQKNFGPNICSDCGMTYTSGVEEDDQQHKQFHSRTMEGILFRGWKNENVVFSADCVRFIAIERSEKWKLISRVLEMVHRDLGGCPETSAKEYDAERIFLLISQEYEIKKTTPKKKKVAARVAGCLVLDLVTPDKFSTHRCEYVTPEKQELPQINLLGTQDIYRFGHSEAVDPREIQEKAVCQANAQVSEVCLRTSCVYRADAKWFAVCKIILETAKKTFANCSSTQTEHGSIEKALEVVFNSPVSCLVVGYLMFVVAG